MSLQPLRLIRNLSEHHWAAALQHLIFKKLPQIQAGIQGDWRFILKKDENQRYHRLTFLKNECVEDSVTF